MDKSFESDFRSKKRDFFVKQASILIERFNWLIDEMPDKGLKCADSQKICLKLALKNLESNITGTEPNDFLEEGAA